MFILFSCSGSPQYFVFYLKLLQDGLAEHSVQLEKVKRAGRDLVSTNESPSLKAVDILCAAGTRSCCP